MHRRTHQAVPTVAAPAALPPASEDNAIAPLSVRIATAVKMTGIGRSKIYELIQEGEIEIVKIGSVTLIPVASLQRLLERNRR